MNLKSFDKKTIADVRRDIIAMARGREHNANWSDRMAQSNPADRSFANRATRDKLAAQLLRGLAASLTKGANHGR